MLLRSDILLDYYITFLLVDGFDDVPILSSLISRYLLVISDSFVLSLRSLVSRFLPGLETFNEGRGRREAGIGFLTLTAYLLLDSGVLEFGVVFSASYNISHRTLIFC